MNYPIVFYILGWVLNIEAVSMLLPLSFAFYYKDKDSIFVFFICIIVCLIAGLLMIIKRPKNKIMYAKEGFVTVALCWIVMSIFGTLPFILSGCNLNFIDALFETVSGFTTTGASILNDVEALPKSLLVWRSFTHWIGGMGVLVFLVALLPLSGGENIHLIKAESPGPKVSKLVPRIRTSAMILYGIYMFFTLLELILLLAGGMSFFEALTTTFGTAGTGGFGVKNSSLGGYSSYIQNVVMVFMIIFGIDFSFYYLILMRKFKMAFKMDEVKGYLLIIIVSIAIITINCRNLFSDLLDALKHVSFQVASIITTTGFSTHDFDSWTELSKTILIILMFIGACAGSTGGGIKVSRVMILMKSIIKEIKVSIHPRNTVKVMFCGRTIEHDTLRSINVYMISYMIIFAVSLLIISLDNLDFSTNFTAVAATINNIGPGLSLVGPTKNFSVFSSLSKVVLAIDMLVGRLEIFPILVLFAPSTWKK